MNSLTDKIRTLCTGLLKDGKVDMIVGFKKGTIPMSSPPCVARTQEQAEELIWDSNCTLNLANYLTNRKEKIGVIAKGCDSRNIVNHIIENKVTRENLYIIGVPCDGMVDKRKIRSLFDDDITRFSEKDNKLFVETVSEKKELDKKNFLKDNCTTCIHRNPVIYDELATELVEEQKIEDRFADVRKIENMSSDDKWNYFNDLIKNCIRCYACRNACPLCYCPTCFVDESNPQWVGKGQDINDVRTFHILRAYHCAGRCTDCGACEEACPMDIHMRAFTRKLVKDSCEIFDWEPGLDPNKRPVLDTFNPDDPDEFIR